MTVHRPLEWRARAHKGVNFRPGDPATTAPAFSGINGDKGTLLRQLPSRGREGGNREGRRRGG